MTSIATARKTVTMQEPVLWEMGDFLRVSRLLARYINVLSSPTLIKQVELHLKQVNNYNKLLVDS